MGSPIMARHGTPGTSPNVITVTIPRVLPYVYVGMCAHMYCTLTVPPTCHGMRRPSRQIAGAWRLQAKR